MKTIVFESEEIPVWDIAPKGRVFVRMGMTAI